MELPETTVSGFHFGSPLSLLCVANCEYRERAERSAIESGDQRRRGGLSLHFRQKLWPARARELQRLLMAPARHRAVIAAQQHGRNLQSFEQARARVMRIFEQTVLEALLLARGLLRPSRPEAAARKRRGAPGRRFRPQREHSRRSISPRAPRRATTRSSTPSKRAQRIKAPGPSASARTRACVSGAPRGLMRRRGRTSSSALAASSAAQSTSARMTMPGPPPAGVSSTARWRPTPCSRICRVSRPQTPRESASPASDRPKGPGNISGNSVRIVARHMRPSRMAAASGEKARQALQRGLNGLRAGPRASLQNV